MRKSIEKIRQDKKRFLELLLLADPSEEMIDRYLADGDLFVMREGETLLCVAVVCPVSEQECELKNIAVSPDIQGKGLGSKMIAHLLAEYHGVFETMIVGTADASAAAQAFYQRNGFRRSRVLKDFFTDNYPDPVYDEGKQCIDMVILEQSL